MNISIVGTIELTQIVTSIERTSGKKAKVRYLPS